MKKMALFLTVAVVFGVMGAVAVALTFPSLPDDLNIVDPDPSLPKELAAFSGKWAGTIFFAGRAINLFCIMEKINATEAQLYLYGSLYGDLDQWEKVTGEVAKEYGKYKIYFKKRGGYNQFSLRGKYLDLSISSFTATFTRF